MLVFSFSLLEDREKDRAGTSTLNKGAERRRRGENEHGNGKQREETSLDDQRPSISPLKTHSCLAVAAAAPPAPPPPPPAARRRGMLLDVRKRAREKLPTKNEEKAAALLSRGREKEKEKTKVKERFGNEFFFPHLCSSLAPRSLPLCFVYNTKSMRSKLPSRPRPTRSLVSAHSHSPITPPLPAKTRNAVPLISESTADAG